MTAIQSNAANIARNMTTPPGVTRELWEQTLAITERGLAAWDRDRFHVIRHRIFHRLAFTSASTTSLQFFGVSPSDGVCNVAAPNLIGNDRALILIAPRVEVIRGIDVAGAIVNNSASAGTAVTPFQSAASYEALIRGGRLTVECGTRKLVDGVPDLANFPAGRGINGSTSGATTVAATTTGACFTNNGTPEPGNAWPGVLFPIPGGKQIKARIDWMTTLATFTTMTVELSLDGYLVLPAND